MSHRSSWEAGAFRNTGPRTESPYVPTDEQWNLIADLFPDSFRRSVEAVAEGELSLL
jgi:hypothetical protein